jgi:hypothetical protein
MVTTHFEKSPPGIQRGFFFFLRPVARSSQTGTNFRDNTRFTSINKILEDADILTPESYLP